MICTCYIHASTEHFVGHSLTAASLVNTRDELRSSPEAWMVVGFIPHLDGKVASWPAKGGNSLSVRQAEIIMECLDSLLQGWNTEHIMPKQEPWADGVTRMTHTVFAGWIGDKQELDKMLGLPGTCHVCACPPKHHLNPEYTFPQRTGVATLKAVLKAVTGSDSLPPRPLLGRDVEGRRVWLGTHTEYDERKAQAGGVHLIYNPLHEVLYYDANQQV